MHGSDYDLRTCIGYGFVGPLHLRHDLAAQLLNRRAFGWPAAARPLRLALSKEARTTGPSAPSSKSSHLRHQRTCSSCPPCAPAPGRLEQLGRVDWLRQNALAIRAGPPASQARRELLRIEIRTPAQPGLCVLLSTSARREKQSERIDTPPFQSDRQRHPLHIAAAAEAPALDASPTSTSANANACATASSARCTPGSTAIPPRSRAAAATAATASRSAPANWSGRTRFATSATARPSGSISIPRSSPAAPSSRSSPASPRNSARSSCPGRRSYSRTAAPSPTKRRRPEL
jgi:hypothetical protein